MGIMVDTQEKNLTPFDYVKAASYTKEDIMTAYGDDKYISGVVNKAFSYYPDTILYANEINNYYYNLTKSMEFDYYRNALPKRKRWSKWHKKPYEENHEFIVEYLSYKYNCNRNIAEGYMKLMSKEHLDRMLKIALNQKE